MSSSSFRKPQCLNPQVSHSLPAGDFIIAIIDPGLVSCGLRVSVYRRATGIINCTTMDILNFGAYPECYARVIAEFDARKHLFDTCHCVLIENQMTISKKMYRVYQHMLSYFLIRYHGRGTPIVYEVDPKFKTSGLGAPRFTKKDGAKANKKWAVAKAWSLCHDRRDTYSLELLRQCGVKAREDLADTICYEEAFFLYFFSHWQEFPVSIRSRMGL